MTTFDLNSSVYVSTDDDLDAKYRVSNDTERDALITGQLVKIGHSIYHVADNKHYSLSAYPTIGSLTGAVWTEIGGGSGGGGTGVVNWGSGYMDIGDMRMQWGAQSVLGAPSYIYFPMPYDDTSYTLQTSISNWWGAKAIVAGQVNTGSRAIVGITDSTTNDISTQAYKVSWLTVGKKPV